MSVRLTSVRLLLLVALTSVFALPGTAGAEAPSGARITLDVVSVNGSGCPPGTAGVAVLPDNTGFRVTYRDFLAEAGGNADPVDFRSFQKINLYTDKNMFYGKDSTLNSVATIAGFYPWVTMKDIYLAENAVYRGEQMHSFDAVFSDKGSDGNPLRLCDHVTGALDKKTFEHWKQYDISLYLRNNWPALKNELQGKIRVSVGEQDNFLLNDAVHVMDGEMKKLDTQFEFAYYPGDHFTVGTPEYRKAGLQFLEQRYQDWKKIQAK